MDWFLLNTLTGNLLGALLVVIPIWRVFARAGLHPALSLLVFLPFIGLLIVLAVLALSRWPSIEGAR